MDPTKLEPAYIGYLPPWMLEEPNRGVGNKTKYGKKYLLCKEHRAVKGRWVLHKKKNHRNQTRTSLGSGVRTKS